MRDHIYIAKIASAEKQEHSDNGLSVDLTVLCNSLNAKSAAAMADQ